MSTGSTESPSIEHLDWGNALRGVNGDFQLLQELVQIFLDEVPKWLDQLRRAIAAGDRDAARRTAHTVKGAVSQLSMTVAKDLAQQIENFCRDDQFDTAKTLYQNFETELAALRPHQLRYIESTRSR